MVKIGLLFSDQFFLHVDGDIKINIGKISSLPKSITKDRTIFEK